MGRPESKSKIDEVRFVYAGCRAKNAYFVC